MPLLKRIRDGGKLCQVFVSPEGARTVVKHLGGRGFLLVIEHSGQEFVDPERAQAFLKTLAQEDISREATVSILENLGVGVQTQVCFRPHKGGLASALQQVFSSTEYERHDHPTRGS